LEAEAGGYLTAIAGQQRGGQAEAEQWNEQAMAGDHGLDRVRDG
jgi:hypothetical protein